MADDVFQKFCVEKRNGAQAVCCCLKRNVKNSHEVAAWLLNYSIWKLRFESGSLL